MAEEIRRAYRQGCLYDDEGNPYERSKCYALIYEFGAIEAILMDNPDYEGGDDEPEHAGAVQIHSQDKLWSNPEQYNPDCQLTGGPCYTYQSPKAIQPLVQIFDEPKKVFNSLHKFRDHLLSNHLISDLEEMLKNF